MRILTCSALLMTLMFAGPALGADDDAHPAGEATTHAGDAGHGAGHDAPPLLSVDLGAAVWNILIFFAVVFVLGKFVWPQILEGLRAREGKIRDDLEQAEKANADARRALEEYKQRLAEAQAESRQMIEQARTDAEQLRAKLKTDTESEVQQLRDRATQDIDRAKQQALTDLYAHSAELATAVAAKILQRQVTPDDTQRLIDESLQEMDRTRAG